MLLLTNRISRNRPARTQFGVSDQSAERIILSTATPDPAQLSRLFPLEDITLIVWQRDQIVDLDGKPLFADSPRVLHKIAFSLDEEEIDLRIAVTELSHLIGGSFGVMR